MNVTHSTSPRDGDLIALTTLAHAKSLVQPALEAAALRLCPELRPAVEQHLAGGGKFVRAGLALLSTRACEGNERDGVAGAVAIELVHNFSIVHDDIMDGDVERRHRPTMWVVHGVGNAIIAGDALFTVALQVLLDETTRERTKAVALLASATQEMITGQAQDMASEQRATLTVDECLLIAAGKTGALLSCATALGAVLAGASEANVEALGDFGLHLGIAFQAVDDVLGIWGDTSVTGKTVGNDLRRHKKSLPVCIALAQNAQRPSKLSTLLDGHDLDDEEVVEASALLDELGARRATMTIAEERLDRALTSLQRASISTSDHATFEAIARYVIERDQ
jgi:geranylgeranyl diphosphate synthase type I